MPTIPIVLAMSFVGLSLLLRLVVWSSRSRSLDRFADLALLPAAAAAVWFAADPSAWTQPIVSAPPAGAPQPADPRLPVTLLLTLAAGAMLPDLLARDPRARLGALASGSLVAILAVGTMVAMGLREALPLAALAMGAIVAGATLDVAVRVPGARARATLAASIAGVAAFAGLTFSGARSDEIELVPDQPAQALGYSVALREVRALPAGGRELRVELQKGSALREFRPALGRGADGRPWLRTSADPVSSPLVAPVSLRTARGDSRPTSWLARGDTLRLGEARVRFDRFRMLKGDTVRVLADLTVDQGGLRWTISPGMLATPGGSRPFPVELLGVGPIAVARMDADGGRVALQVGQDSPSRLGARARVRMQLRPGLPGAWAALILALLAAIPALTGAARRPSAVT